MTNTVKTQICSQNLTIISDDSVDYINNIATELDCKIRQTVKENSFKPLLSNVIFCALQYCDENNKLTLENKKLREQLEALTNENDSLKNELARAPKQTMPKSAKQQSFFDRDQQRNNANKSNEHNKKITE